MGAKERKWHIKIQNKQTNAAHLVCTFKLRLVGDTALTIRAQNCGQDKTWQPRPFPSAWRQKRRTSSLPYTIRSRPAKARQWDYFQVHYPWKTMYQARRPDHRLLRTQRKDWIPLTIPSLTSTAFHTLTKQCGVYWLLCPQSPSPLLPQTMLQFPLLTTVPHWIIPKLEMSIKTILSLQVSLRPWLCLLVFKV